jgi:outer membrane protein assembly factor BamB
MKWSFSIESFAYSSPAIGADGTIYVGSYGSKLYAINPNGSQKWNLTTGWIYSSPAIGADGTIYVGSLDHKLYAIAEDDLTINWPIIGGVIVAVATVGLVVFFLLRRRRRAV